MYVKLQKNKKVMPITPDNDINKLMVEMAVTVVKKCKQMADKAKDKFKKYKE